MQIFSNVTPLSMRLSQLDQAVKFYARRVPKTLTGMYKIQRMALTFFKSIAQKYDEFLSCVIQGAGEEAWASFLRNSQSSGYAHSPNKPKSLDKYCLPVIKLMARKCNKGPQ
jgi:hypothetical protein